MRFRIGAEPTSREITKAKRGWLGDGCDPSTGLSDQIRRNASQRRLATERSVRMARIRWGLFSRKRRGKANGWRGRSVTAADALLAADPDGKALTPFGPATLEDLLSVLGRHPFAESVLRESLAIRWLISAFHQAPSFPDQDRQKYDNFPAGQGRTARAIRFHRGLTNPRHPRTTQRGAGQLVTPTGAADRSGNTSLAARRDSSPTGPGVSTVRCRTHASVSMASRAALTGFAGSIAA